MKHINGPWKVQHEFDYEPSFVVADGEQDIAEVCPFENGVGLANARLIAAAPDLLAALKIAQEHISQYRKYSDEMSKIGRGLSISSEYQPEYADNIIKDAISKAEGR